MLFRYVDDFQCAIQQSYIAHFNGPARFCGRQLVQQQNLLA